MKVKAIPEEKKWLLHNLAKSSNEQQNFIDLAQPLLEVFCAHEITDDYYGGYAVEFMLFKPQSKEFAKESSLIDESKKNDFNGWSFFPSKESSDDCYIMKGGILMKHHLLSFLWFKN